MVASEIRDAGPNGNLCSARPAVGAAELQTESRHSGKVSAAEMRRRTGAVPPLMLKNHISRFRVATVGARQMLPFSHRFLAKLAILTSWEPFRDTPVHGFRRSNRHNPVN
jgi:hypothetical protein